MVVSQVEVDVPVSSQRPAHVVRAYLLWKAFPQSRPSTMVEPQVAWESGAHFPPDLHSAASSMSLRS